eukprot:4789211-Amphidinium_carterae.1
MHEAVDLGMCSRSKCLKLQGKMEKKTKPPKIERKHGEFSFNRGKTMRWTGLFTLFVPFL